MENGDQWLATDKLQHFLACFLITVVVSSGLCRVRHSVLRRWSVSLGAVASLAAGAAKEAGDEIGLWESSGASVKDAVADVAGVVVSCLMLSIDKRWRLSTKETGIDRGISMV